jgi:2-polyprenyl-3-methyl-5-hydroxy-6-metoxy-1,4-benzoquinol methylase
MVSTQLFDQTKADAFAGQMLTILNGASSALMISIGHQTGLFDRIAELPPASSAEIAAAAGLNERYVREWLGAMVSTRLVEYNPLDQTYRLPPEHAAFITRAAGPDNLGFFTQYIALMGSVEQDVIECFRKGGGVPYSAVPRFQRLQAEETASLYDATLIDVVLPLVPGLVDRLRIGMDVADVGCGGGHAINLMAQAFPQSHFTGYDFSEEGISMGRAEAARMGLANATFEVKDIATLNTPERYALVTAFDTIHDQAQPARVLRAIFDAVQPAGVFLMQDIAASSHVHENIDHPLGTALYTLSTMHCMTVSLAQGGEGLGTVWGEQLALQMLADAGFADVEVKKVPGDILNNYYLAAKR